MIILESYRDKISPKAAQEDSRSREGSNESHKKFIDPKKLLPQKFALKKKQVAMKNPLQQYEALVQQTLPIAYLSENEEI